MRIRTTRFLSATAMAASACLFVTGTAGAVEGPNGIPEVIAAVGSDTTYDITKAIFAHANAAPWNYDPDLFVNIPPTLPPGGSFTVPGDDFDTEVTYTNPGNLPPNGSIAGRYALRASAEAGDGRIDIARSSSGPSLIDPLEFEYYGFARDAVTWSTSSIGPGAGVTLNHSQLRDIYRGTITDWREVGGQPSPIQLYLPQYGSGTLAFFTGTVLGFDPANIPGLVIKRHQEHVVEDPLGIDYGIQPADRLTAITPFSVAQWVAQGNDVVTDKRADFFLGELNGAGSDGPLVSGSAGNYVPTYHDWFLGSGHVYHVLDNRTISYPQAKNAVGFDDYAGPSPLCNNELAGTLAWYGFKPLPIVDGVSCVLL